jgi:hypothetical protein
VKRTCHLYLPCVCMQVKVYPRPGVPADHQLLPTYDSYGDSDTEDEEDADEEEEEDWCAVSLPLATYMQQLAGVFPPNCYCPLSCSVAVL